MLVWVVVSVGSEACFVDGDLLAAAGGIALLPVKSVLFAVWCAGCVVVDVVYC